MIYSVHKSQVTPLMSLRVADIAQGARVQPEAKIIQRKAGCPVQFEIRERARLAVEKWIAKAQLGPPDFLCPSRVLKSSHLSRRQYARIVDRWVSEIGLILSQYGTHSLRRTKASLIYGETKNLGAVIVWPYEPGVLYRALLVDR